MAGTNGSLHRLLHDDEGAALLEYGILLLLILALCIAAATAIGSKANGLYTAADLAYP